MAERLIRIGRVSSVNYESGMVKVTYPDLDDSVTDDFPVFSLSDEYKMPGVGQDILVLHLSNGQSAGVVMGKMWNESNVPPKAGHGIFRKDFGSLLGSAFMEYDENTGVLLIEAPKINIVSRDKSVVIDGDVNVNGDVTADGKSLKNCPQ